MMSIAALAGAQAASAYYAQNPEADYYMEDRISAGSWFGRGAAYLTLEGPVAVESLQAVLDGQHPVTGEVLAKGVGASRRSGWDVTFSAPKSVSILALIGPAQQRAALCQAHDQAVVTALRFLESHALVARRGKAGQIHEGAAGLVCATFLHATSRLNDPQVHTHCPIANLAPRTDGTFGAIESKALYEWKMAVGAVYRAELAEHVRRLGYLVEADHSSFRITGLPKKLEKVFSSRRQQIEAGLAQGGVDSSRAAERIALRSRKRKVAAIAKELDAQWAGQCRASGFEPEALHALALQVPAASRQAQKARSPTAILRELTARQSVFRAQDLYRTLAQDSQASGGGIEAVESAYQKILRDPEVVCLINTRGQKRYTSREMQALESSLLQSAKLSAKSHRHRLDNAEIDRAMTASSGLSAEQAKAVHHCCGGGDLAIVNGVAGSGKSTMARAIGSCYRNAGYTVIGSALAGKAAQQLEQGSGIASQTLHSLLGEIERGAKQLTPRTVLVLDEAGMVGSRMLAKVQEAVREGGSKLVLIGDARQLQPIDAGGIYNALLERVGCASLTQIRRQRQAWAVEAVRDLASGRAELALAAYQEQGDLILAASAQELRRAMVADWCRARELESADQILMLAGTRADVRALNTLARSALRERKQLAEAEAVDERGLGWAGGDRIVFGRNSRLLGVKNGDLGTVRTVVSRDDGLHFVVDLDGGQVVRFGSEYAHIDHGYAVTVHKAQGATAERVLVQLSEGMSDREWGYVAASRAREQTRLYCPRDQFVELTQALSKSHQKDTSLDYLLEPELE